MYNFNQLLKMLSIKCLKAVQIVGDLRGFDLEILNL